MRAIIFLGVLSACLGLLGCPQQGIGTSLTVNIAPAAAVADGARWNVDGGAWRHSGDCVSQLSSGSHVLTFADVAGWANPGNQTVLVTAGQPTVISAAYTSLAETGVVMVTIEPEGARAAFGQWRVDDGQWHASGESVLGVPVGKHLVSFSEAPARPGWIKPNSVGIDVDTDPTVVLTGTYTQQLTSDQLLVLGYNDLGMHCMNQDYSEFMILPPYNTLHAQVIDRSGAKPRFVQDGVTVSYSIPSNTTSAAKTNFWDYAQDLFGLANPLPPDIGLAGNGLSGTMTSLAAEGRTDWSVLGIPITPLLDDGTENSYPLALITVAQGGNDVVQTQAVTPISWEIRCDYCHNTPGISVAQDILLKHDRLHGTTIAFSARKPVLCGSCHPQPELGLEGDMGMASLSSSMHSAHAKRMWLVEGRLDVGCYACHPGEETRCMRDVHHLGGMICTDCHGGMAEVGDPSRQPWQDEPRCGTCHQREGFEFEQANTLFRDSKGHYGVHCEACHGSPHAITPTSQAEDNVQAMAVQGRQGVIKECAVCHSDDVESMPFEHQLKAQSL